MVQGPSKPPPDRRGRRAQLRHGLGCSRAFAAAVFAVAILGAGAARTEGGVRPRSASGHRLPPGETASGCRPAAETHGAEPESTPGLRPTSKEFLQAYDVVVEELLRFSDLALQAMSKAFDPELSRYSPRPMAERLAFRLSSFPKEELLKLAASNGTELMAELCPLLARSVQDLPWLGVLGVKTASELRGVMRQIGLKPMILSNKASLRRARWGAGPRGVSRMAPDSEGARANIWPKSGILAILGATGIVGCGGAGGGLEPTTDDLRPATMKYGR